MVAMAVDEERISVGMGEFRLSRSPHQLLVAYGLGSCVCLCAYDPVLRLGGMLHALVPERQNGQPPSAKYADVGAALLLEEMQRQGATLRRLVLKLAGGAQVLALPGMKDRFDIGARNTEAVMACLSRLGLRPAGVDVGGKSGRTVLLHIGSGKVMVRNTNGVEREL